MFDPCASFHLCLSVPTLSVSSVSPSMCPPSLPPLSALSLCTLSLPPLSVTPPLPPLSVPLSVLFGAVVSLHPTLKSKRWPWVFLFFCATLTLFSALLCLCLEKLNLFLCCFATVWYLLSSCLYRFASQTALDRAHNPTVYAVLGALASSGPSWSTVGLPWGSLGCPGSAWFSFRVLALPWPASPCEFLPGLVQDTGAVCSATCCFDGSCARGSDFEVSLWLFLPTLKTWIIIGLLPWLLDKWVALAYPENMHNHWVFLCILEDVSFFERPSINEEKRDYQKPGNHLMFRVGV